MVNLISYFQLIGPGLVLAAVLFFLIPRDQPILRLLVALFSFVLIRDSLIPAKIWQITPNLEMRFADDFLMLALLGLGSLSFVFVLHKVLSLPFPELFKVEVSSGVSSNSFLRGFKWAAIISGLIASGLVLVPVFSLKQFGFLNTVLEKPQGGLLLPSILFICLAGNFLEEVLFRGYLQEHLNRIGIPKNRAALISAVTFSFCHIFLAFTVTEVGTPILTFTLWEGLICAFLASRFGLLSATLAHGLGIFWIAIGL